MKVGVVCPYDLEVPGGVQQVARELTARLEAAGDQAVLVGPGYGEGWASTGRSISIRGNRSRAPVSLAPGSWRRVRRALSGVDVVHVHEPFLPIVGLAALTENKPTVVTFHADPSAFVRRVYRMGARIGDRLLGRAILTAVSPVAASALPGAWGEPAIVPNGVAVASFASSGPRDPSLVAFLGRDDPRKGFDILAKSWPIVLEAMPDARLVVAGFERSEAHPSTTFLGRVSESEKRETLSRASVLVAPNLGGESFGIVIVEGLSAGCAVVASDLPAFRSVAGDGARFVAPGDHGALAGALVALLADPAELSSLSARGSIRAAMFDWDAVVSAYRKLYQAALESA